MISRSRAVYERGCDARTKKECFDAHTKAAAGHAHRRRLHIVVYLRTCQRSDDDVFSHFACLRQASIMFLRCLSVIPFVRPSVRYQTCEHNILTKSSAVADKPRNVLCH